MRPKIFFILCFTLPILAHAFPKGKIVRHLIKPDLEVEVYLPANYEANRSYKTIYCNDGETIFNENHEWKLHTKLDKWIWEKKIEPIILVAIHVYSNRNNWYIPYQDEWVQKNWGNYTPQAQNYTEMLIKDLIPFIEKTYSVTQERAILGYSLGGLQATWAGLKYPEVFSFSVAFSPSFWLADYALFKENVLKKNETASKNKFWFDIGTAEWDYYVPFYQKLQEKGYEAGKDCFYYEVKDGTHTAEDWLKRIEYPLIIFAGTNRDFTPKKMQIAAFCIPSASGSGKIYRRVSASVSLANGVKYTLSNTAQYKLLKGDIKLLPDGTITALGTEKKAEVEIQFRNFRQIIAFQVENCK